MATLLVVDDEQSICWGLSRLGKSIGHDVLTASSAEEALESVDRTRPDVIILDVRLPGMDGLQAIGSFRDRLGDVPIIVITAYGDLQTAVDAVRNGAFEYIVKPFELDLVERTLARALRAGDLPVAETTSKQAVRGLVGSSAAMQDVFKHIALAAASDASVLLVGESGTGKELAARAIHKYSNRADGRFVAVNIAALSPSLAESELFGHVRGAFTSADQDRVGLLAQANGGTLFLDEVADIPLPTQVKLLRALEHGEVVPVGGEEPVPTDFRVISATHQNLLAMVRDGSFRHDLFFRLGAFRVDLPPLREREGDIVDLAKHFLGRITAGGGIPISTLSAEAITELENRTWLGNVRELRNVIEHAVIVSRGGVIDVEHLPPPAAAPSEVESPHPATVEAIAELIEVWAGQRLDSGDQAGNIYDELLSLIEPSLFRVVFENAGRQCASAARLLGIHRTTLRKKLDQYDIADD